MADVERSVLKKLATLSQISPQFSEPHYSNLGLALVGRAVGKVVAPAYASWEDYVTETILKPLGMRDTGNPDDYVAGQGARARLVEGIDPPSSGAVPIAMNNSWDGPCGAMHSSMRDMVRD